MTGEDGKEYSLVDYEYACKIYDEYNKQYTEGEDAEDILEEFENTDEADDYCPSNVYPSHKMFHAMGDHNYVKVYEQIMNMSLWCRKYGHNSSMYIGYPDGNPGEIMNAKLYVDG